VAALITLRSALQHLCSNVPDCFQVTWHAAGRWLEVLSLVLSLFKVHHRIVAGQFNVLSYVEISSIAFHGNIHIPQKAEISAHHMLVRMVAVINYRVCLAQVDPCLHPLFA